MTSLLLSELYCYVPTSAGGRYEMKDGVRRVPRPNSRTKKLGEPKIGRMEAHHTGNQKVNSEGHKAV